VLTVEGPWHLGRHLPASAPLIAELGKQAPPQGLAFDSAGLTAWDSGLVNFITKIFDACKDKGIQVDSDGLPEGVRSLLRLAYAVPERKGTRRGTERLSFLAGLGTSVIDLTRSTGEIMAFLGEVVLTSGSMLRGKARYRRSDLWAIIQEAGADALPIVSLVTFLVGVILAYIGGQQLAQFGARIYVADLVGLAMVIQMSALITAIVLAGRTGAAFAAQLGTMQVNEEIDALRTLGIKPMEFLVLPRMLALVCMTPLLAIYANLMGILGGALVGFSVYGISPVEYATRTQDAIGLNHLAQGVINATIYGAIVAVSGCLRGMQCGRSAASVGLATTSAVVTSIVFIVIAAAVMTVVFDALGL